MKSQQLINKRAKMSEGVYIIDARRTAIANLGGAFSGISAHNLGGVLIKDIVNLVFEKLNGKC